MQQKRKLVYILSPSFSGSTLLTLLIAQHSRIATIGELKATSMGDVKDYNCSCGLPISTCPFWTKLQQTLEQQDLNFSFSDFGTHFTANNFIVRKVMMAQIRGDIFERLRLWMINFPGINKHYQSIIDRNHCIIEAICKLQNADIFLDGSKDPQRLMYYFRSGLYDIKVIRMVRDGRAQCNSRRQKPRRPVNFKQAVDEWTSTICQMDRVLTLFNPENIKSLRYEDLCSSPQQWMEELFNFVGLEPVNFNWENIDIKQTDHHILGNTMRTQSTIKLNLDTKWKSNVSAEEFKLFEQMAGSINRKLGYVS